jgi:hypothetical protein
VQSLVQGGIFAAPRSRLPEDQIGRPAQDATLELLVVGVILAMMLILSLRWEIAVRDTRAGASA